MDGGVRHDAEVLASVIVELRRALRRANGRSQAPSKRRTESQAEVLRYLGSHPGTGTNTIAAALRLSPNTVSAVCSALVREGALSRQRDPADGRAARFYVTDDLAQLRAEKHDRRADVLTQALAAMEPADQAVLTAALPVLATLIRELDSLPDRH